MKLNKLEEQILQEVTWLRSCATEEELRRADRENDAIARIAAKIALELAEKAYESGYWLGEHNTDGVECGEGFDQFKQEIL